MSVLEIIEIALIVLVVLIALFFVGGIVGRRRHDRALEGHFSEHVAHADQMLEQARASDRGWDRPNMEEAVRRALSDGHPDFGYDEVHLVHVADAPGTETDEAHFVALGPEGERRVVLRRSGDHWAADSVE